MKCRFLLLPYRNSRAHFIFLLFRSHLHSWPAKFIRRQHFVIECAFRLFITLSVKRRWFQMVFMTFHFVQFASDQMEQPFLSLSLSRNLSFALLIIITHRGKVSFWGERLIELSHDLYRMSTNSCNLFQLEPEPVKNERSSTLDNLKIVANQKGF